MRSNGDQQHRRHRGDGRRSGPSPPEQAAMPHESRRSPAVCVACQMRLAAFRIVASTDAGTRGAAYNSANPSASFAGIASSDSDGNGEDGSNERDIGFHFQLLKWFRRVESGKVQWISRLKIRSGAGIGSQCR